MKVGFIFTLRLHFHDSTIYLIPPPQALYKSENTLPPVNTVVNALYFLEILPEIYTS